METLKIAEYKNILVCVRRIGKIFEFIFEYDKKFYHAHNIFMIPIFRFPKKYTFIEKQNGAEVCFNQAKATIDKLLLKTK